MSIDIYLKVEKKHVRRYKHNIKKKKKKMV